MIEFIAAIIKPDALNEWIDINILRDLEESWFKVRFRKIMQLGKRHLPYVYADKINTDREPFALYSISHGLSMLLILEAKNAYQKMLPVKWNSHSQGGIREKYRLYKKEQLEEKWFTGKQLEYELCKNKIHTSDSVGESCFLLSGLLTHEELLLMEQLDIKTYREIKKNLWLTVV